ncbi:hypothetical protein [Nakamurella lactea]|uniref:hypothetical protein n=1 Tax=Nakamurella lactea TaxID=459515 RepID=UPI0012B65EEA|nr:hypothetical protein [Nakamurella lactea]
MHRRRGTVVRALAALATVAVVAGCTGQPGEPVLPPTTTSASPSPSAPSGPTRSVSAPTTATPPTGSTPTSATSGTASAAGTVPAVVRLQWLGKRPSTPGVEIGSGSTIEWQSRNAGEYALIHGPARQWFGADGSAVGCASDIKCVGVDAAGYTAVVLDGRTRLVYRPDGQAVGRFAADGRRVAGPALPSWSAAIAETGVDLAALLDQATTGVPFAGGITGDPHVLTAGGRRYSTQLTGQYYARSGDPAHAVQVRLEPLPHQPNVSVVTAVAVGSIGSVLEYTAQGAATLDGTVLPAPEPFRQVSIPGGPDIGLWAADAEGTGRAAVVWPDGASVVLSASAVLGMTVVVSAPRVAGVSGLFGVGGPDPANDLQDRQGAALDPDTVARDWAVKDKDSMFSEQVGPTLGFPSALVTVPEQALPFAEKACRAVGLTTNDDLTACEFDVGLTGDDGFALGHAAMALPADRTVAPELARRFPALLLGSTAEKVALPEIVNADVAAGQQRVYELTTTEQGAIGLEFVSGCRDDEPQFPSGGGAAVRLFDEQGHAVSHRFPACGQPKTSTLPAGRYFLAVAGPASGGTTSVRLQVRLP